MSPQSAPQSAVHPPDEQDTGIPTSQLRHDIRTPLNHIVGYSEILIEEEANGAITPLLHSVVAQARETLAIVKTLLVANEPTVQQSTYLQLQAAVQPSAKQMEDLVRRIRVEAPTSALADVERIGVATAKLRAIAAGAFLSRVDQFSRAGDSPESSTGAEVLAPSTQAAGTILVVDDSELNRDMLSRQLVRQNHEVDVASSGVEALEMLRRRHYDILILDVIMPGMNGFEVLERVKRDAALQRVAVIVVSALDEVDNAIRCIELGAEDYLFRPVNPTLLGARIRSMLDRIRSEEALRRRQRFESIGMLAAGVAHDFNNLLTGIIGNAHLLTQVLANSGDREMAQSIVQSGERAAELIRQLLAYSGKGMIVAKPLQLSSVVQESERLIRASLPGKAELRLQLKPVPDIKADANQIRQALLNLSLNAAESVPDDRPNCVTIETGVEEVSTRDRFELRPEEIAAGQYVYLDVSDTGCGIDSEALPKLFEPFYSTKFLGRGLGLAAVAGIVRTHQGLLRLSSSVGAGSSFRLYFPAIPSKEPDPKANAGATVLVVDDELVIRQIAKIALERAGHQVLLAETGAAAIQAFEQSPATIAVVLLDLRMPSMNGTEVLQRLQEINPGVSVIVSSGLPRTEVESQLGNHQVPAILQKPYKVTDLVSRVEDCLASAKSRNH